MTPIDTPMGTQDNGDTTWDENFAASPSDLDAIMTDAETKKRMTAEYATKGETSKKKKALTSGNTLSRAGRTQWSHIQDRGH